MKKFQIDSKITQTFLKEGDLIPQNSKCPSCQSLSSKQVYQLQDSPLITLNECRSCSLVFASRTPKQECLDRIYSSFYENSDFSEEESKVMVGNYHRLSKHIFRKIKHHISQNVEKNLSILDFGGGDGSISIHLAEIFQKKYPHIKNINIHVVDYAAETIQISESISLTAYKALEQIKTNCSFDIIIASAVMEHVPSPQDDLDFLLSHLKPQGIFYARTPYFLPFMKLFDLIGKGAEFIYPVHLHDMGPAYWNNILTHLPKNPSLRKNFKILISKPSPVEASLKQNFTLALGSYFAKFPWIFLRNTYKFVGGWEIFILREK